MNNGTKGCLSMFLVFGFTLILLFMPVGFGDKTEKHDKIDYSEYTPMSEHEFYSSSFKGVYMFRLAGRPFGPKGGKIGFITSDGQKRSSEYNSYVYPADTGLYKGMEKENFDMASGGLFSTNKIKIYSNKIARLIKYKPGDSIYKEANKHYVTINGNNFFMFVK